MATNFDKLQKLLEELFQLDQADLDFGIYRIMNQKRDEVVRFLEQDLLPQVTAAFSQYRSADKAGLQSELDKAIEQANGLGVDPEATSKVQELRRQIADSNVDVVTLENEVFSHLYNFFRRYYHEGDFISLRRYKEGVYAIPYEGEEVKLHWANHDQYYIKSSEYLRDYTFKLPSGRRAHFRLIAGSTEQDNKKAAPGKERRFILCDEDAILEDNGELHIRFEYRPDDKKRKQDALNEDAVQRILAVDGLDAWIRELSQSAPTKANPDRTVLAKHLAQYTARNTFDYFIHKDLGGFLRRELDFYIKNEVMHLDDIEHEAAPRVEQYLSKIKVIRKIAHKIILFLEQLENFQKKLWLKKKFVVETNYCITLDRVPEELYPEIAANEAQREEWVKLFAIDEIQVDLAEPGYSEPLTAEFLQHHQGLSINTSLFSATFRENLIQGIEDWRQNIDGVLIHSENFQALRLLSTRFRSRIAATYIDPPYNTGDDGFPYKDSYQHSSWISMMGDRLALGRQLERPDGTLTISIDDAELDRLCEVVRSIYGEQELAKLVWDRNRKNDAKFFSVGHEYMLVAARNSQHLREAGIRFREPKEGITEARECFNKLRRKHQDDWDKIKTEWMKWFDSIPVSDPKRRLMRYTKVGPRGPYRNDGNINWPGGGGPRYEVLHPTTKQPCRKPVSGWRYPTPERFWEEHEKGRIAFGPTEKTVPSIVSYLFESEGQVMPSVFYSYAQTAAQEFDAMFGARVFDNPKNWRDLARVLSYLADEQNTWVVDYFAGSGSTAHAAISLSREDSRRCRFILVEMGAHFDRVLIPRVRKAAYAAEWKEGKPLDEDSLSHCFKYLRLESYEDALNNLELKRTKQQATLLGEDAEFREEYVLSYMLDVESRGSQSLLNVEAFRNPDGYKLKVERDGETRLVNVDLVETFNWLLGLTVRHMAMIRGVRVVEGENPDGERVLVLWRNLDETDNDTLDAWFKKQKYNTQDQEYDLIYVNGDNTLENLRRPDQTWKVRMIEEAFSRLMFDVQDV